MLHCYIYYCRNYRNNYKTPTLKTLLVFIIPKSALYLVKSTQVKPWSGLVCLTLHAPLCVWLCLRHIMLLKITAEVPPAL